MSVEIADFIEVTDIAVALKRGLVVRGMAAVIKDANNKDMAQIT